MKKNELCAGDVILFPPHKGDFIAQAIAFLTDGEVNHAALCYPENGVLMIAESILKDGLVLNPFQEHIDGEYPLRVCRRKGQNDMKPVLFAARKYLEEKNTYPNFNLGLLGVLLLFKKFAPHTWKNKVVYSFALLVASELMQLVRKHKYADRHPMSCSQFVAQCFTDAGAGYDLNFETLVVDFEVVKKNAVMTRSQNNDEEISPVEMLNKTETSLKTAMHTFSDDKIGELKISDQEKLALTSEFMKVTSNKIAVTRGVSSTEETVSSSALKRVMANIAFAIYELQTGVFTTDLKKVLTYLKSSTARNFFVSPQDLLANCTDSLEHIGNLSY